MSRNVATYWVNESNKPRYEGPADKAHEVLEPGVYDVDGGGVIIGAIIVTENASVYVGRTTARAVLGGAAVATAALLATLIRRHGGQS